MLSEPLPPQPPKTVADDGLAVSIDRAAQAVYISMRKGKVAKTCLMGVVGSRVAKAPFVAIDVDDKGNVLGVEVVAYGPL